MQLKRLIAENVYSFHKIDIQLDDFDLVQVTGRNEDELRTVDNEEELIYNSSTNGIGKTNIYNCIIQALYSRDIYKTKKSFLKNMFTKGKFWIQLDLSIEKAEYRISYKADECILYKNESQYITGRAAVTEFFENLIPFELFLPLTYISTTISFPFFTATPNEQKQFMELVFADLNKFKESIPKLKERLAEEIKQKNKREAEKELYEEQASVEICELLPFPDTIELEDFSNELHSTKNRMNSLENIKKEVAVLTKLLDKPLKEVAKPEEDVLDLKEREGKGKGLIETVENEVKKLKRVSKDSICSLCGNEIDVPTNKKLLKEKEEELRKLEGHLVTIKTSLKNAQAQQMAYSEYQSKLETRREQKDKLNGLVYDEREYNNLIVQVQKIEQAQEIQVQRAKEVQEKREYAIAHNERVKQNIKQKEEAESKLETLAQDDKGAEITKLKLLIEICEKVIVNKQIPKRLSILERFINMELANFTSQYKVSLTMEKNKIKPSIIKNKKVYPIENTSRGERARLNVSLIFAIRNILVQLQKEIYNINLLYIDELTSTLDFSGKHLLLDALKAYKLNKFLVSHDYVFPNVELLNLIKKDNKTVVEK